LSPNDVLVLRELAILYDLMGQEKLAESLYLEIVRMTPDIAASHNNLGMNLLVQQKYPQAILSFLQALNINRESVRIKNNLATAYALNGNTAKALRLFADTVGEASAHNNLGYLYMTQGKLELAEEHLKRAIAIHPKYYPKAQENLARLKQAKQANRLK
jgi:Flp pilus assembly protein TadD